MGVCVCVYVCVCLFVCLCVGVFLCESVSVHALQCCRTLHGMLAPTPLSLPGHNSTIIKLLRQPRTSVELQFQPQRRTMLPHLPQKHSAMFHTAYGRNQTKLHQQRCFIRLEGGMLCVFVVLPQAI